MRLCVCGSLIEHKIKSAKFCSDKCKNISWQGANWDKVLSTAKKYRNSHIRSDAAKEQTKEWRKNNRDRVRKTEASYHKRMQNNKEYLAKRRYHEAMRRARKLQATPKWLTKEQVGEIRALYNNCPEGYHVDHIMPLRGKNLSGLHVPWNLQCLPGIVNKVKSNKVEHGNSN